MSNSIIINVDASHFTVGKYVTFVLRGILYEGTVKRFSVSDRYEKDDTRTCYELEFKETIKVEYVDEIFIELWYDLETKEWSFLTWMPGCERNCLIRKFRRQRLQI
jgi:hypothetical protein